jgi:phosphate transport system substrate-binding protein
MQQPLKRMAALLLLTTASSCLGLLHGQSAQIRAKVSPQCPQYLIVSTISGTVDLPGTDDLTDLGDEWNHGYQRFQMEGGINYQPKLTREVVQELVEGKTAAGITDREFTPGESQAFRAKFGYLPMRFPVCLDANIIYVNKDNPLVSLTMAQLDAIYSKTLKGGAKTPIRHWSDLGVKGPLGKREINAYARGEGTASRASFADQVLLKGEFRAGIIDKEDSAKLAEAILGDPAGIAFGSFSAWYTNNKVLSVVPYQTSEARFPTQENVTSSKYPMPRLFYVYVNRPPGKALEPRLNEALHYILSSEGQNQVADVGMMPGPVEFLIIALKRLDR